MNERVDELRNENKILKRKLFRSVDIVNKSRCKCEITNYINDE